MKITPYPAELSFSPASISSGGGTSTVKTKPEDDFVFTWQNLVDRLDICERCMVAGMIAGLAVAVAALVVWPFREAPGVSADVLGNVILDGSLCYIFLTPALMCYMQWKHDLSGMPEAEPTTPLSTIAASDLV